LIVVANILYSYVNSIPGVATNKKWWLLVSRFIMGVGSGTSSSKLNELFQNVIYILFDLFQAIPQ